MKKIAYMGTALALIFTMACGNNGDSQSQEEGMTDGTDQAMEEMDSEEDENERNITVQELPESVQSAINSVYENFTIKEVEEITAEDGVITYEVELKHEDKEIEVVYDAEGKILSIEEEEDDDDDDAEDEDQEGNTPE
jgi:hypothetical protein